ncbi:MAG: hypothetical protein HZC45_09240 [Deltaproteobacteria bacterium]|nr:hypothetical protein [Deltaproteobacteria bacterium]
MKKDKKIVIKTKDIFKKIRKPVAKPTAVEKDKTRYNRKGSKNLLKKLLTTGGTNNEGDI